MDNIKNFNFLEIFLKKQKDISKKCRRLNISASHNILTNETVRWSYQRRAGMVWSAEEANRTLKGGMPKKI